MSSVLYVTSVPPWPLSRNGGGQRTRLLQEAMIAIGHDVHTLVILPVGGGAPPDPEHAAAFGVHEVVSASPDVVPVVRSVIRPLGTLKAVATRFAARYSAEAACVDAVRRVAREVRPDIVVVRYAWTLGRCGDALFDKAERTLLDFDDVDWLTLASEHGAQPWPGIVGRLGMAVARRTVRKTLLPQVRRCDGVWVTSQTDADALAGEGITTTHLPNVPADPDDPQRLPDALPPSADGASTVLFVGDLRHGPNAHGLDRFLRAIWPLIHSANSNAVFRIVGKGLSDELCSLCDQTPGVEVAGFVEDLRDAYAQAAVVAVPCWWGGGTKIKVAEAAAMGRAQVATPLAMRGFDVLAGTDRPAALVADDDAGFSSAVLSMLTGATRRHAIESAGPTLIRDHLSFATVRDAVGQLLPGRLPADR